MNEFSVFVNRIILASIAEECRQITAFKLQNRLCTEKENIRSAGG